MPSPSKTPDLETGSGDQNPHQIRNANKRLADSNVSAGASDDNFSRQYSQRRKRLRTDSEKAPVQVATESGNRVIQRTREVATQPSFLLCGSGTNKDGNR